MNQSSKLANSVRKYIKYSSAERRVLDNTLSLISSKLPETAIFGGMLREFSLGNAKNFSSDIDLVSLANHGEIYHAIKEFNPSKNKFGGFRFLVGKQLYDIWSFEDTWAFREGIIKGDKLTDLLNTTFFNLDSAIFHLSKNECNVPDNYQKWINNSLLELNLRDNPSPSNMARRAIKMAIEKKLAIGPMLASFLISQKIESSNDLITDLFIKGIQKHLESDSENNYVFQPQKSFITSPHKAYLASLTSY